MKHNKLILLLTIINGLNSFFAFSHGQGNPGLVEQFINQKAWNFVENRGQFADNQIKYYGHQGGVYLYCQAGKISFVFSKSENNPGQVSEATGSLVETQCLRLDHASATPRPPLPLDVFNASLQRKTSTSRTDLILLNSNPNAQIIASGQQKYYENYYTTGNANKGITHVHTFKTIIYKNIYPNIDMELHVEEGGMKYEFIVNLGGKVSDIQMQWIGLEKIERLKNLGIEYSFGIGKMKEGKPVSYQGSKEIASVFTKDYNRIGFKTGEYNKRKPLVIDPTLVWGTYFGGSGQDFGLGVAADSVGNVYITGNTTSRKGIVTTGAYQTSFEGNGSNFGDAYIAKFNSSGSIQWATYYGGDSGTRAWAVATDGYSNVYITGNTNCNSGISTKGSYQTSYGGGSDAFLADFSSTGTIQWATYYGGNDVDYGYGVATDKYNDVYIAGNTNSKSGIATNGAYQTSFGGTGGSGFLGGLGDAFLAKFSVGGQIQWSTYYGGTSNEVAWHVATDGFANAYITGGTTSNSSIATKGAYKTSYSGNEDAFVAKFNGVGSIQWATYYGGDSVDEATGVAIDNFGSVYLTGFTESSSAIATNGAYQKSFSGNEDAFLAKFNSNGVIKWGTYYGGNGYSGSGFITTNISGDVYISGGTTSSSGIATRGSYRTYLDGSSNIFLAKFIPNGTCTWATYYGTGSSYATDMSIDGSGNIYITGSTTGYSDIATRGAYQTSYAGGNGDAFLVRFNFKADNDAGISSIPNPNPGLCPGLQNIKVNLHNYGLKDLNSATIGWSVDSKTQTSYFWTGKLSPDSSAALTLGSGLFTAGQDTVKAWTSMPNGEIDSLPENDTFSKAITVNPLPVANVGQGSYAICTGTHIKIGANAEPHISYLWASVPAGFTSTLPNPVVKPSTNTVYYLSVSDSLTGCVNKNSAGITVSILQAPVADAGNNQSICLGASAQIGSNSQTGNTYSWTSNPVGFISTISNPIVTPNQTTSYSLTVTSAKGCTDFDSATVAVNPRPQVITGIPFSLCAGVVIHLGAPPIAGYIYSWTSKPSGFFSNLSNPIDSPTVSTTYYLKGTIAATGCMDSSHIFFDVLPQPRIPIIGVKNIKAFEYQFTLKNPDSMVNYAWIFVDSQRVHNTFFYDSIMYHTYAGNGNYELTVKASESHCAAYGNVTITVNEAPSLNIFPNPFGLETNIDYTLIQPGHVRISIIDDIGRRIGTLLDKQLPQGEYNTTFSGVLWETRPGMYFVIFQLDDKVIVRKIIQIGSIYY